MIKKLTLLPGKQQPSVIRRNYQDIDMLSEYLSSLISQNQFNHYSCFSGFHRPYDDHVARCGSQRVDKGAEDGHSHVGGETAAAVFSMGALAQLY